LAVSQSISRQNENGAAASRKVVSSYNPNGAAIMRDAAAQENSPALNCWIFDGDGGRKGMGVEEGEN